MAGLANLSDNYLKIGLALGAGCASELAHIGVLKVLQRENIPSRRNSRRRGALPQLWKLIEEKRVSLTEIEDSSLYD